MSQIGVSFTPSGGSPVYSFVFDNFGGNELPRSYQGNADFSQSANGTSILNGPAYRQKYIWVFSTVIETTEAYQVDAMYRAWDQDRSQGLPAACGVADETFGTTVNGSAIFSTPPSFVRMGPKFTLVSFGLTEV